MVFWLAVGVGGIFAFVAVQIGFYATWTMLFNVVVATYMAVVVTPYLITIAPAATDMPCGCALLSLSTAVATMLISYGICYACLSGRLCLEFPKMLDTPVAGLMGFLTGFLVMSFLAFVVSLTPWAEDIGLDAKSQPANTSYMCWWCNRLHAFIGDTMGDGKTGQDAVRATLAMAFPDNPEYQPKSPPPPASPASPATPAGATSPKPPGSSATAKGANGGAESQDESGNSSEGMGTAGSSDKTPRSDDEASSTDREVDSQQEAAMEEELSLRRAKVDSADAIGTAIGNLDIKIIEVANRCTVDKLSPDQAGSLKEWVSHGGVLWANNDILTLFQVQPSDVVRAGNKRLPCIVPEQDEVAQIFGSCKNVVLKDIKGMVYSLSGKGFPLMLLEDDAGDLKAGTALWSLVRCGKGWVSDPKPVDPAQADGRRFLYDFRRFCLSTDESGSAQTPKAKRRAAPTEIAPSTSDASHATGSQGAQTDSSLSGSSTAGSLSGIWQVKGARFRIDDDGQTVAIGLVFDQTLRTLTGQLDLTEERPEFRVYSGTLDVVFPPDATKHFSIMTTATAKTNEPRKLYLHCEKWPTWNKMGQNTGAGPLNIIWTRAGDIPAGSPKAVAPNPFE